MGAAAVGSNLLLFALVFGMSATVDIKDLKKQIGNKNALLTGVFLQFVVLPFLGFAVVKALNLSAAMGVTLLVVTSSPGGSYSNWWCSMFNADLALSVTMTAISTLLSIIMLPINLTIYTTLTYSGDVVKNLDWVSLFVSLVVVIGAITFGLFCSAKISSHKFNLFANKLGNIAGISLVVFSILVSGPDDASGSGEGQGLWDREWIFYFGVAAPCILGLVLANLLTSFLRLAKPERVTASVECCYQNVGIATSVAISMFEGDELSEAIGVPLFYGLVEAVVLGFYCVLAWKIGWTKAPKDEKLCVVIMTSYEVEEAIVHDVDAIEVVLGVPGDGDGKGGGSGLPSDLLFSFDEENGYHIDESGTGLVVIHSHPPGAEDDGFHDSASLSGVKSAEEGSLKSDAARSSRDGAMSPEMVLSLGSVDEDGRLDVTVEEEEDTSASSCCPSPTTSSDFSDVHGPEHDADNSIGAKQCAAMLPPPPPPPLAPAAVRDDGLLLNLSDLGSSSSPSWEEEGVDQETRQVLLPSDAFFTASAENQANEPSNAGEKPLLPPPPRREPRIASNAETATRIHSPSASLETARSAHTSAPVPSSVTEGESVDAAAGARDAAALPLSAGNAAAGSETASVGAGRTPHGEEEGERGATNRAAIPSGGPGRTVHGTSRISLAMEESHELESMFPMAGGGIDKGKEDAFESEPLDERITMAQGKGMGR